VKEVSALSFFKKPALVLAIGLMLALLSLGWKRVKPPPNILLITIDALRADHLGLYGYERDTSPNIDKFFSKGIVYERAYSTETSTPPSVVSFLTGLLPQETGLRIFYQKVPKEMMLVSDHLANAGYQTAGIVSNIVLTNEAMDLGLHFDYFDDYVDERESDRKRWERTAGGTTDAAVIWHATAYDPEKPYFLWLHYQDPHGPYRPPLDKPTRFTHTEKEIIDPGRVPEYQREPDVDDGFEYVDRYDEEIAYMDHYVGKLLHFFDENDLLDNTVVFFSADHGESMMEHEQWFTHGYHVYEEISHVPLMIRYPKRRKRGRVKTTVSLVDLAPTILDIARVDSLPEMRGRVLKRRGMKDVPVYVQGGEWRSMTYEDKKWLIEVSGDTVYVNTPAGVYNLKEDPSELELLPWVDSSESQQFTELIASDPDPGGIPVEYARGRRLSAPKVRPGVDEKLLDKLRSLGYVK
jgi:arylsulfatase